MAVENLGDFEALEPFFAIVKKGLAGLADGEHFFDLLSDDVVFEYVVTVPGYPRRIEGRAAVAELYRPYGTLLHLDDCDELAVHHDARTSTVVLEYASRGRTVRTGAPYRNHYVSILRIRNGKVVHWRDYLDPVAVFDALGWPEPGTHS